MRVATDSHLVVFEGRALEATQLPENICSITWWVIAASGADSLGQQIDGAPLLELVRIRFHQSVLWVGR